MTSSHRLFFLILWLVGATLSACTTPNPSLTANRPDSPLFKAVESNDYDTVARLLGSGEPVNVSLGKQNLNTPLHLAAYYGYDRLAGLLLDAGANPKDVDASGNTPLVTACKGAKPGDKGRRLITRLVRSGSDINHKSNHSSTCLHNMVQHQNHEMLRWFLGFHPNVNIVSLYDGTPLNLASESGLGPIVATLLDAGADPNLPATLSGATPLLSALQRGHRQIAIQLLQHGARSDVYLSKNHSHSIFSFARRDPGLTSLLLDRYAGDPRSSPYRDRFLHYAAIAGPGYVEKYLKLGLPLNSADSFEQTAVYRAIERENAESVKLLTDRGALEYVPENPLIMWPTEYAASLGNLKILDDLLARGGRIRHTARVHGMIILSLLYKNAPQAIPEMARRGIAADKHSLAQLNPNPVFSLSGRSMIQSLRYLIDLGFPVDRKGDEGNTALHHAARLADTVEISLLLQNGADKSARNNRGEVPLVTLLNEYLREENRNNINKNAARAARLLAINKRLRGNQPLLPVDREISLCNSMIRQNDLALYKALTQSGILCTRLSKSGNTPLHLAARYNRGVFVRLLLDHGANPDQANLHGKKAADYTSSASIKKILSGNKKN